MGRAEAGKSFAFPAFLHARAIEFITSKPIQSPYKILIVREFHLVRGQESFRRVMEKYPYCRMILTSTNPSSIISPIASRCVRIQFGKTKLSDFLGEIQRISAGEGIKIPMKVSKLLYSTFSGNIGISTHVFQLTLLKHRAITKDTISDALKTRSIPSMIPLLQASFDRSPSLIKRHLDALLKDINPREVYEFLNETISQQDLDDLGDILQYMAEKEIRLLRGYRKGVQLLNILMEL